MRYTIGKDFARPFERNPENHTLSIGIFQKNKELVSCCALQKTIRKREGGFAAFSYFSRPKFNSWTSDDASPVIGEFCGDDLPASFISPSNEILLVFKSDDDTNYKGFQLEYKTSSKSF